MSCRIKQLLILLVVLSGPPKQVFGWGGNSHSGMTGAAAKFVFGPFETGKIDSFFVPLKYSMAANFSKTMMMGFGDGIFTTFVGVTLDNVKFKDDIAVDDTMYYSNSQVGAMTIGSMFSEAGQDPDDFDKDVLFDGGPTILHMYSPNGIGYADVMTEYFYDKAKDAFSKKDTLLTYVYLGYASHYLVDCGIPVHNEVDYINVRVLLWQWQFHGKMESWVSDNWNQKWKMEDGTYITFQEVADNAAQSPVPICDIAGNVRALSFETYPDLADWMDAWGKDKNKGPKDKKQFVRLVFQEIWRCVPRVTGMFMKFKSEEMK